MNSTTRGRLGEDFACRYLKEQGYTVLARNFHAPHGELDIIASDGRYIAFIEVKSRKTAAYNRKYGRPALAVTESKKAHVVSAVMHYLRENPSCLKPRIDVIEVYTGEDMRGDIAPIKIKHYKNAFGADPSRDEA